MMIYEVNISLSPQIEKSYLIWLRSHIKEMLLINGFMKATLLKEIAKETLPSDLKKEELVRYTVHYEVSDETALMDYLKYHAEKMRANVPIFNGQWSIARRIFSVI